MSADDAPRENLDEPPRLVASEVADPKCVEPPSSSSTNISASPSSISVQRNAGEVRLSSNAKESKKRSRGGAGRRSAQRVSAALQQAASNLNAASHRPSFTLTTTPPYHQADPSIPLLWSSTPPVCSAAVLHPAQPASHQYPVTNGIFYGSGGSVSQSAFHVVPYEPGLPPSLFSEVDLPPCPNGCDPVGAQEARTFYYHDNLENSPFGGEGGNEGGVLGWGASPPSAAAQTPVLDLPAVLPSATMSASHNQEAQWKQRCLCVTCAPLPQADLNRKQTLRSPPDVNDASPWEAVVWRWLRQLGMGNQVADILCPGTQRMLVRWSSDCAAEQWKAKTEAAGLHVSRQVVFEHTLLKWS